MTNHKCRRCGEAVEVFVKSVDMGGWSKQCSEFRCCACGLSETFDNGVVVCTEDNAADAPVIR